MKTLYTAEATSTGAGRDGHVRTSDGILDTAVAMPPELGGPGGAANPELFFAAGYAACFHSALRRVAQQEGADLGDSSVRARVGIGAEDGGGFALEVALQVTAPGVPLEQARALVDRAHGVCPYSKATRGTIDVEVTAVEA